jgi:hypothetical protein
VRRSEFERAAEGSRTFNDENYKFGWLQGSRKLLTEKNFWLRGVDLNHRPLGYESKGNRNIKNLQDAGGSRKPCKERQESLLDS